MTTNVSQKDTFELWRQKTNQVSDDLGSVSLLNTTNKTSIVSAINEVQTQTLSNTSAVSTIGDKNNLITSDKTNLVAAINECKNSTSGNLNLLTTDDKTSIVGAVNEVNAKTGTLSGLSTTIKTNLVAAVNEIVSTLNSHVSSILGITLGGTGSSTAAGARTNLGLGTIATQDANNVSITGGSVSASILSGIAPKSIIDTTSSANQFVSINAGNSAFEFKTLTAGTGITINYSTGTATIVRNTLVAGDIPGLDWTKITSGKPTTLAGYGITDGAPIASPTFTGIATSPQFTSTGTTGFSLTNVTSNVILYNQAGYAPPSFTTRSVGTKIVLFPQLSASFVDHAIGIEGGNGYLWHSVPNASSGFKWYAGTTNIATMDGAGNLNANSFTAPSSDITNTLASRIAVEQGSNNVLKWQTITNFFLTTAGFNSMYSNRGRTIYIAWNVTATAGIIYACNAAAHPIITLPDNNTSQLGDTIDILPWYYPFDDTNYVDILTPTGVYIAWKASAVGNGDTFRNNFGPMTLVCSYAQTGVLSKWSIM